jgi:hypothetical protein
MEPEQDQTTPVALNLDNEELFVIERLQYGAQFEDPPGGGGSSNCNCNSNCNGSSEEPLA